LFFVLPALIRFLAVPSFRGLSGAIWQRAFMLIGRRVVSRLPDVLNLEKIATPRWGAPGRIEELAGPLRARGFRDCGVYSTARMPGLLIMFLLQEESAVAAFLSEHPKRSPWVELSVRYDDGTTTALSTLPPTGLSQLPDFFRRIEGDPAVATDVLYDRLLAERSPLGIKRVTAESVVPEYERAYAKFVAWRKNHGISSEEVAAVAKKWLEKKDQPRL
jgi:hypothetical protein